MEMLIMLITMMMMIMKYCCSKGVDNDNVKNDNLDITEL